jgi:hypothetical protein
MVRRVKCENAGVCASLRVCVRVCACVCQCVFVREINFVCVCVKVSKSDVTGCGNLVTSCHVTHSLTNDSPALSKLDARTHTHTRTYCLSLTHIAPQSLLTLAQIKPKPSTLNPKPLLAVKSPTVTQNTQEISLLDSLCTLSSISLSRHPLVF